MARSKRPAESHNVMTVRTVNVSGSPRHLAKTHGSHNERTNSWPHLSDAIDRPAHMRDTTRVKPVKPVPTRHHRLSKPRVRSTLGTDSLRAHSVLGNPRWDVHVLVDDRRIKQHVFVDVTVTAHDSGEAERLALQLAEKLRPCIAVEATAERR